MIPYAWRPVEDGGLGLHQLTAGCAAGNRASARVLRRAGFRLAGTERQAIQVNGRPDDALVFDLLAADDREAQRVEPGALPVIETSRFRLRPWTADDVPEPDEAPDAASLRFMPPGAHPDAASFPSWLRRRELGQDADEHLNWAIADRETDHALGNLTVFRLDPVADRFQAEIGYWLHPTARGKGVLPEVMPAIIDHAFAPVSDGGMGLSRLYAATDLDNGPSQAVLLRAGFRRWGQDRHAFRNADGDVTDGAYFELLATDERVDRRPQRVDDVTLEGDRVRLRPWRDDDAERVVEGCTDERARQWLRALPDPYTLDQAAAYIRRCRGEAAVGTGLFLAMANPDDDTCVGSIALMGLGGARPDQRRGGVLGASRGPRHRGHDRGGRTPRPARVQTRRRGRSRAAASGAQGRSRQRRLSARRRGERVPPDRSRTSGRAARRRLLRRPRRLRPAPHRRRSRGRYGRHALTTAASRKRGARRPMWVRGDAIPSILCT